MPLLVDEFFRSGWYLPERVSRAAAGARETRPDHLFALLFAPVVFRAPASTGPGKNPVSGCWVAPRWPRLAVKDLVPRDSCAEPIVDLMDITVHRRRELRMPQPSRGLRRGEDLVPYECHVSPRGRSYTSGHARPLRRAAASRPTGTRIGDTRSSVIGVESIGTTLSSGSFTADLSAGPVARAMASAEISIRVRR